MKKHLQANKCFTIPCRLADDRRRWEKIEVRPVNGEECFNQLGLSAGFIHWAHPRTGEMIGYCGVDYFDKKAIEVE